MLTYIIEVSCCWLLFYAVYILLLQQETFFRLNRWYLLGTLLLSLAIPLAELPHFARPADTFSGFYLQPITIGVQALEVTLEEIAITPIGEGSSWRWSGLLAMLYWAGLVFFACRFVVGLHQIYRLKKTGTTQNKGAYTLVETNELHLPFSFLDMLFWSTKTSFGHGEQQQILRHELAHIRQKHTFDVLILEVLLILFWCSPLVHWYRKSLRDIHEYLADQAVLHTIARQQYGRTLLRQSQSGLQIALAHNFLQSQLKKRILMMTKDKSTRKGLLKYSLFLPVLIVALLVFSSHTDSRPVLDIYSFVDSPDFDAEKIRQQFESILGKYKPAESEQKRQQVMTEFEAAFSAALRLHPKHQAEVADIAEALIRKVKAPYKIAQKKGNYQLIRWSTNPVNYAEETFKVVEEMPRFAGCEDVADRNERSKCAQMNMLQFVYKNLKYPAEARKNDIQGTVVVRFVINKNGEVKSPEIARDIGGGCGEAVLEVVSQMPHWIPGRQKSEAVNVEFNLPVKFKLEGKAKSKDKATTQPADEPYKVVEQMPRFPGCEDENLEGPALSKCSNGKLIQFIIDNIKYPKAAKAAGVEGTVVVKFVVDELGKVGQAQVVRSVGHGCDTEVLRLIELMNHMPEAWMPGRRADGKAVRVWMNLPFKFALPKDSKAEAAPLQMEAFSAFPNPASDVLNLSFQTTQGPLFISLTDAAGKEVYGKKLSHYDGSNWQEAINVKQAARGAVFIKIYNEAADQSFSRSVLLQ